ncbi:MAG: hypothetical protein WKG00_00820 [Polyangiaceae bacterium]
MSEVLKQDWLMRQIEQAFAALARAFGLAKAGQVDQAIEEVDGAIRAVSGMTVRDLLRLDTETLRGLVSADKHAPLAELLRGRATILESTGRLAAARATLAVADELAPSSAARDAGRAP